MAYHHSIGVPDIRCWMQLTRPIDGDIGDLRFPFHMGNRYSIIFPLPYQPKSGDMPRWEALAYYNEPIILEYLRISFWDVGAIFKTSESFINSEEFGNAPMSGTNPGFHHNIPHWYRLDTMTKSICFPAPCQPVKGWDLREGYILDKNVGFADMYVKNFGKCTIRQYTSFVPDGEKRDPCFVDF